MGSHSKLPQLRTDDLDEKDDYVNVNVDSVPHEYELESRQRQPESSGLRRASWGLQSWTSTALLLSYFLFSIAFYTVLSDYTCKVFWFLYLTIATLVAGATALEAYDGLTPLREARKAVEKANGDGWKFKTADDQLPSLHLIFDDDDDDDDDDASEIQSTMARLATGLMYPEEKVMISILRRAGGSRASVDYAGAETPCMIRVLAIPAMASASLSSRVAYCLALDSYSATSSITAIFRGEERPHPHAARLAVEKLCQDAKVDVVQGRSIQVPSGKMGTAASLEHDMVQGLLQPGSAITWGLSMPDETNSYWRTETLRAAATASANVFRDGYDLPFLAAGKGVKSVNDLKVISFMPAPTSFAEYWSQQIHTARQWAIATVRYTKLAFSWKRKGDKTGAKWTLKSRFAVLYKLPIMRLVSNAVLQYFCLAFATLIVRTPTSTADFARTIYFPYPVSEWFIIIGLICLVATVAMAYAAKSEFIPLWTAPLALVLYPLLLLFRAGVDVFGQLDALVR